MLGLLRTFWLPQRTERDGNVISVVLDLTALDLPPNGRNGPAAPRGGHPTGLVPLGGRPGPGVRAGATIAGARQGKEPAMTDEPTEQPPPRSSQPSSPPPEQPTEQSSVQPTVQPSEQSSAQPAEPHAGDVVDLLLRQHAAIRRLCDAVIAAPAGGREEPFHALLRLLAVHEAVEEEIVHPYVKRRVEGSRPEVEHRIDEEREVKKMLAALDVLGPDGPGFDDLFARFRTAMLAHADKEESTEFAGLRAGTRPSERTAMAAAVRVASALAPTHPHPGIESGVRTVLVGTPLAMIDRARDMLRGALAGARGSSGAGAPDAPGR
jgi:hypothetical protein